MEFLLTPYNKKREAFAWWDNAFSSEELDWIQSKAKEGKNQALVSGDTELGSFNPSVRRSELNWIKCNEDTKWVFQRLAHVVSTLNNQYFFFDLTGFGEAIQLTNYDEKYSGMYGWHIDFSGDLGVPSRKLSLVLQLSDPSEYEGGVLELKIHNDEAVKMKKQRGLIICFPAWTLHQVTPVTQGSRQSLVSWITGPSFI